MNAAINHSNANTQQPTGVPPEPPEALHQAGPANTPKGERKTPGFDSLLQEALTQPGFLSAAYTAFHGFSIGNQVLAAQQLLMRGLPLSPIASFNTWKERGRFVRKGEMAICLFMPTTVKAKAEADGIDADGAGEAVRTVYRLRPNWFALYQTEGEDFAPEQRSPQWDAARALAGLSIEEVPFELLQGNCMGYAQARSIAVSPLAPLKHKTRFHELAHVVLGHTEGGAALTDGEELGRADREMEAESVAHILCSLLGLPGAEESRGYLRWWMDHGGKVTEKNAARIFGAADRILKAGQPAPSPAAQ